MDKPSDQSDSQAYHQQSQFPTARRRSLGAGPWVKPCRQISGRVSNHRGRGLTESAKIRTRVRLSRGTRKPRPAIHSLRACVMRCTAASRQRTYSWNVFFVSPSRSLLPPLRVVSRFIFGFTAAFRGQGGGGFDFFPFAWSPRPLHCYEARARTTDSVHTQPSY